MSDTISYPLISIITINYNGLQDTCELIDSLYSCIHSVTYEIIVVDNASENQEASVIKKKYPSVHVIESKDNLGFSGGNNLGIRQAKGDFILLLNNDTLVEKDGFHQLIETFNQNPSVGMVCPKIRFADDEIIIQYAGYTELSSITLRNRAIGLGEKDKGQYNKCYQTSYVHGAAVMIRKEAINKVGLMPEIFFLYYEEIDWSTSFKEHGYEIWYNGNCTIYHKESQSVGQESAMRSYYMMRNRLLYAWRHKHGWQKWASIIYLMVIAAGKNSMLHISEKKPQLALAIFKGIIAFIFMKNKLKQQ